MNRLVQRAPWGGLRRLCSGILGIGFVAGCAAGQGAEPVEGREDRWKSGWRPNEEK